MQSLRSLMACQSQLAQEAEFFISRNGMSISHIGEIGFGVQIKDLKSPFMQLLQSHTIRPPIVRGYVVVDLPMFYEVGTQVHLYHSKYILHIPTSKHLKQYPKKSADELKGFAAASMTILAAYSNSECWVKTKGGVFF